MEAPRPYGLRFGWGPCCDVIGGRDTDRGLTACGSDEGCAAMIGGRDTHRGLTACGSDGGTAALRPAVRMEAPRPYGLRFGWRHRRPYGLRFGWRHRGPTACGSDGGGGDIRVSEQVVTKDDVTELLPMGCIAITWSAKEARMSAGSSAARRDQSGSCSMKLTRADMRLAVRPNALAWPAVSYQAGGDAPRLPGRRSRCGRAGRAAQSPPRS